MMLIANVDAIREQREKLNLSRHQVSMMANLPGNALSRIEAGQHKVHPLRAAAIATILGKKIDELFNQPEKVG